MTNTESFSFSVQWFHTKYFQKILQVFTYFLLKYFLYISINFSDEWKDITKKCIFIAVTEETCSFVSGLLKIK